MSDFGFIETNLEASPSTSSWSLRFTLMSDDGRWLSLSTNELTSQPERARLITARQARNIQRQNPELASLTLRKGPWK